MADTVTVSTAMNDEDSARRRKRSIAIALVLGALVVLFYVITIVHMGPGVINRPL
ncbi:MAG: DUF1129 domain-containing protein [Alphaproteobacteria bacterium]|nr:DUF1129 domain-containing protein [Alphaproteobacteria bacterium]